MTKYVYTFGSGSAEGKASDKNLLGGKGANLAEMCSLGIPCQQVSPLALNVVRLIMLTGINSPMS